MICLDGSWFIGIILGAVVIGIIIYELLKIGKKEGEGK